MLVSLPLIHRSPTPDEVEQLRLILSTYQDGFGMLAVTGSSRTLPGWRDFERTVATVFGGVAQENKGIFDILVPKPSSAGIEYGLACKMRNTLRDTERTGRVTMELSNASGGFWDYLNSKGYDSTNYRSHPAEVGAALTEMIESWHDDVSLDSGGTVDVNKSCYLTLSWHRPSGRYQLHQFDIGMPDPDTLTWSFPPSRSGGQGRRLLGEDATGKLLEWYPLSGGQLKYYPSVSSASWCSKIFELESLPELPGVEDRLIAKAELYFHDLWSAART